MGLGTVSFRVRVIKDYLGVKTYAVILQGIACGSALEFRARCCTWRRVRVSRRRPARNWCRASKSKKQYGGPYLNDDSGALPKMNG